jgi:hypothetical protein
VNGLPGLVVEQEAEVTVVSFTLDRGRIRYIDPVRNPEKLTHLR